MMAFDHGWIRI